MRSTWTSAIQGRLFGNKYDGVIQRMLASKQDYGDAIRTAGQYGGPIS